MEMIHGLAIAGMAGTLMGVAVTKAQHAQQLKTEPGYVIDKVELAASDVADSCRGVMSLRDIAPLQARNEQSG